MIQYIFDLGILCQPNSIESSRLDQIEPTNYAEPRVCAAACMQVLLCCCAASMQVYSVKTASAAPLRAIGSAQLIDFRLNLFEQNQYTYR